MSSHYKIENFRKNHYENCCLVTGSSPDEARESAKEALKSALRKSGSNLSPPNVPVGGFNFYDSIHSDPLMNIEFSASSEYDRNRLRRSGSEVDPLSVRQNPTGKPTIKRSQSEAVFSSADRLHAPDFIHNLTKEETVFELDDSFESESNTIANASALTSNETLSKPAHKRSKSDYGGKTPVTKSSSIKKQKPIFDDDIEPDSGSVSNSLPTSTLVINGTAESGENLYLSLRIQYEF